MREKKKPGWVENVNAVVVKKKGEERVGFYFMLA